MVPAGFDEDSRVALYRSLEAFAEAASWPSPKPEVVEQEFSDKPNPTRAELQACQRAVIGRVGLRDPWAYFFKVLSQNRREQQGENVEEYDAGNREDPFDGYRDGQEVGFHDA